jgi:cytoskeletal protein RodZ
MHAIRQGPKLLEIRSTQKGKTMKILTITAIIGLPLMALGQTTEPQETTTQGQTKETETTAPAKGKKMRPAQEQRKPQARPESGTNVRGQTDVQGRTREDMNRDQSGARSSTRNETNVRGTSQTTTVNKQEFKSRHREVFNLGRHPKEFFVQRFGANHLRLIGNTYFVFVDNCWISVDVDGFVYTERVICPGDPDYIVID